MSFGYCFPIQCPYIYKRAGESKKGKKKMTKIIKNEYGQYWNGTCWGVRQAAEDYDADLPWIEGLELEDGAYYRPGSDEPFARAQKG